MANLAQHGAVRSDTWSGDRDHGASPIKSTTELPPVPISDAYRRRQRASVHDILALQRAVGNQACQRLLTNRPPPAHLGLRDPIPAPVSRTAVVQRNGLQPPSDLANLHLADVEEITKAFSEGSHAYLAKIRGKLYVLKLSSEDAEAEAKTAFLAEKLGVPAARAGWIEYSRDEVEMFAKTVTDRTGKIAAMREKMSTEAERIKDVKGKAVVMEVIEGKTLSGIFGLGDEQTTIPEGGSATFHGELAKTGKLETFFRDLGQIAAFDILIGNMDRFAMSATTYQGGLPKGNTGNFMYGSGRAGEHRVLSIDMDIAIGTGPIDESSNITNLKDKFTKWVNRLKTGDYNKIVHAVLLSISEGEDEDQLHGQLMMEPQAAKWITEGINLVLLRVSQLSDSDINSVFDTWKDQSQHYGQYLKEVLESVKDAQNKRVGEPVVSGTKF